MNILAPFNSAELTTQNTHRTPATKQPDHGLHKVKHRAPRDRASLLLDKQPKERKQGVEQSWTRVHSSSNQNSGRGGAPPKCPSMDK